MARKRSAELVELDDPVVTPRAWPPPLLSTSRSDSTGQQTTHPADHNAVNGAVNDIVAKVSAMDTPIGTRNGHTTSAGQNIIHGGTVQWNVQYWAGGVTDVGDHSGWTIVTPGVYAISWSAVFSEGFGAIQTRLQVPGTWLAGSEIVYNDGSAIMVAGTWTGYIVAGQLVKVNAFTSLGGGNPMPLLGGGNLHMYRVGPGA